MIAALYRLCKSKVLTTAMTLPMRGVHAQTVDYNILGEGTQGLFLWPQDSLELAVAGICLVVLILACVISFIIKGWYYNMPPLCWVLLNDNRQSEKPCIFLAPLDTSLFITVTAYSAQKTIHLHLFTKCSNNVNWRWTISHLR